MRGAEEPAVNRRQFLEFTVALAAAASLTRLVGEQQALGAARLLPWIPTQVQVDEWLEHYKICTQQGVSHFKDIMATVFSGRPEPTADGLGVRWTATLEDTQAELTLYLEAERAFHLLESDRQAVAVSQGEGYWAGREGESRNNPKYLGLSNEAFGWYNGWAVGHADRTRRPVLST